RDVAIKVLPETLAHNAERLARFEREARTLASLNHPNIAHVHGFEDSTGVPALVMELVAGPTLADRIAGGPIPIPETLAIAQQVAEALEAAHEQGIVHRDLKPANIKVRDDGTVKVLDFGLAKAFDPATASNATESPTITTPAMTAVGVILGTAAYMSPEQARGKIVDKRADIWAFGVVLYEMVTGVRPFDASDTSLTLALVMTAEPDWRALPSSMPSGLRQLIVRCLQKDPRARLRDIGEARLQIQDLMSGGSGPAVLTAAAPGRVGVPLSLTAAVAAIAAIVTGAIVWSLKPFAPSPAGSAIVTRVSVELPSGAHLEDLQYPAVAVSPDGAQVAYAAVRNGVRQLYIRSLDSVDVKSIPGTEDATEPFFSPDGQWIGFFAAGRLKKVSVTGNVLQALWNAPLGVGGSWGPDDTIYFSPASVSGVWKIPASGGTAQPVTTLDRAKGEVSHRWPQVLPGGKNVLFTVWTGPDFEERAIHVQSLETGQRHVLINGGGTGRYVRSGHLVFTRRDALMAVPLDLAQLKVTSTAPVLLSEPVWWGAQGSHYSVSDTGVLVYVPGDPKRYDRRLVWVDRRGVVDPLPTPLKAYVSPALSPDGRRVAVEIWEGTVGIWIYDFSRGTLTRLTSRGSSQQPTWTPDGRRIVYRGTRDGHRSLFWMAADGSGEEERLSTGENMQTPASLSPDGKWLAYHEIAPKAGRAIFTLQPDGDRTPQLFLRTATNVSGPRFSPDGRWLAFVSDESGRAEICIRPFPGPGPQSQVSTEGGTEPVWSRDGRELFYLLGDKMMAVTIATRPTLNVGPPRVLYEGHFDTSATNASTYDVAENGRFLRAQPPESGRNPTQVGVVINWFEELKARVGAAR
ncbi:MAG TPA: protein kinase, partial [Gemmatimonadaceae bacterium]